MGLPCPRVGCGRSQLVVVALPMRTVVPSSRLEHSERHVGDSLGVIVAVLGKAVRAKIALGLGRVSPSEFADNAHHL